MNHFHIFYKDKRRKNYYKGKIKNIKIEKIEVYDI